MSSLLREKNIPRLMIIVPVLSVILLTVLITYFYILYRHQHFKIESERLKQEYILSEKKELQERLRSIQMLLQKQYENMEEPMKKELVSRVNIAYDTALYLHHRYSKGYNEQAVKVLILGALSRMEWGEKKDYIWVIDKEGNNFLSRDKALQGNLLEYKDADGRMIIQEAIAAVNENKEAFMKTRFKPENPRMQLQYLKDFGHYGWFFSTGMYYYDEYERIKKNMIANLSAIQSDPDEYYYIVNSEGRIIYHPQMELDSNILHLQDKNGFEYIKEQIATAKKGGGYVTYHSKSRRHEQFSYKTTQSVYFKPFDWIITTGFYALNLQKAIDKQQASLKEEIEEEIRTILIFSFILAILVIFMTLSFSRRISMIFIEYKERVQERENALQALNNSLKEQVEKEVAAQREKEKMLIQQSKMAAMGDMISMIAHQWRQPLNQLSYVMMNIEGAYDARTLSREYLETKLKEGENLLEYMSHTIDDFRDFFKSDKQKEEVCLCELSDSAIGLIEKGLATQEIRIEKEYLCDKKLMLYKNEMLQVLLNLLKNAQEALGGKENATIKLRIYEEQGRANISVSDNGGGVKEENREKIFEPYFSTKASQGTGLGLYMSKMIIEEHMEGILSLRNSKEGAEFIISLPLHHSGE
ncbi:MAG: cache domain-containing protein [Campylobacterales bacterium]|nr:cache domain-containing protein [Campylobacterales bacterium]